MSSTSSLQSTSANRNVDSAEIADLIAKHGSSSATAWLDFNQYLIWRPSETISQSSFPPVQGYIRKDPWVFAWGNPLVSDVAALEATARAFISWAESQNLRPVWCCVDETFQDVLASEGLNWSTVSCINEDVIDPAHVVEIVESDAQGVGSHVKDLKKNLRRAEKADVDIVEVKQADWSEEDKKQVEDGIADWKKNRHGIQLASTTMEPWVDADHRRYWLARKDNKVHILCAYSPSKSRVVGLLILAPVQDNYQIKNAVSFPDAPKGTSEALIYGAVKDLHNDEAAGDVYITFGITAADKVKPVNNFDGWRVKWLAGTYNKVAKGAGLLRRGDFRNKFETAHEPMYVCYPEDGLGLDGVNALLKVLKK
ncbi:hypothetical protein BOTBODRAFT_117892 [Botryobasidium botryosum FD-172 SS1]|uniref:Phosphatidylglycerol lysyltransferase C-terminal domain-containing protein n=1 Tax=Botryobasidium botryosum (strain FD-172 SS1) TaxID=930990 RepID=A0A067M2F3_BOTB1|nr:hypothetical protein BOTBODRAFT_117892 [Botryobasidium botryosum FD-172 SS1]